MNTVDALKALYKTLTGDDYAGDPNPTDAEMIAAIAKDASGGGGSSTRVIDYDNLPDYGTYGEKQYELGLTKNDFTNAVIKYGDGILTPVTIWSGYEENASWVYIFTLNVSSISELNEYSIREFMYNSETGSLDVQYAD